MQKSDCLTPPATGFCPQKLMFTPISYLLCNMDVSRWVVMVCVTYLQYVSRVEGVVCAPSLLAITGAISWNSSQRLRLFPLPSFSETNSVYTQPCSTILDTYLYYLQFISFTILRLRSTYYYCSKNYELLVLQSQRLVSALNRPGYVSSGVVPPRHKHITVSAMSSLVQYHRSCPDTGTMGTKCGSTKNNHLLSVP